MPQACNSLSGIQVLISLYTIIIKILLTVNQSWVDSIYPLIDPPVDSLTMNRAFKLPLGYPWYTLKSPAYPGLSKKEDGVERWTCSTVKNDVPSDCPISRVCVFRFVDRTHTKFLITWFGNNPTVVKSHPTYTPAPVLEELMPDKSLRPNSAYGPNIVAYATRTAFIEDLLEGRSWNLVHEAVQDMLSLYSPNGRLERPTNVKSHEDGCRILDVTFFNGCAMEPTDQRPLPAAKICKGDVLECFGVSFLRSPSWRIIQRRTAIIVSIERQNRLEAIGRNGFGRPLVTKLDLNRIKQGRVIIWRVMGESWSRIMDAERSD